MKTKRYFASFCICCMGLTLLPFSAAAAPEITNRNGTVSNGGAFHVYGTGFGAKAQAAPIRFDDFEAGSVGHDVTADFPWWSKSTNTPSIPIDNTKPRGFSTKAIYHYLKAGIDSSEVGNAVSILYRNNVGFAETGRIYVSWWSYWDWGTFNVQNGATNRTSSQIKEIDLLVSVDAMGHPVFPLLEYIHWIFSLDTTPYSTIYQQEYYNGTSTGSQNIIIRDNNSSTHDLDRPVGWYQTSMQIDMGKPGTANGSRTIYVSDYNFASKMFKNTSTNDMVLGDVNNTNKINAIKLGWYRGYTNQGESYVWHDDIYIDNSWARVEIGDKDTYDTCTHREIQIPTAWAADHVVIKLNLGSFRTGDNVYLYVVDENGVVNTQGQLITVGETYSALSKPKKTGGSVVSK
jgi:hypothetical protein